MELAGYFANCIQLFKNQTKTTVRVVYVPNGPDAPFEFGLEGIEKISRTELSSTQLIESCRDFNPTLVYIAGWKDKDYLRIGAQCKKRGINVVGGMDNVWTGSLRQQFASLTSTFSVKPYFTHLWVAGQRQYQFARKLGYSYEQILTGLYSADVSKFETIAHTPNETYLFYVGRFEEIKGIIELYHVFNSLNDRERNGWKLKMVGNGSLKNQFPPTVATEVYDFMQPSELIAFASNAGGFILPSRHEPWGVVVQEFAAAGKPLILSSEVNSGEDYLIDGYNGFRFQAENKNDLKATLVKFFHLTEEERKEMGNRSQTLAMRGAPEYWVAKLMSLNHSDNEFRQS